MKDGMFFALKIASGILSTTSTLPFANMVKYFDDCQNILSGKKKH